MSQQSKILFKAWVKNPISRRSLFGLATLTALASTSLGKAIGANTVIINQILGRPTNSSIALSVLSSIDLLATVEYGYTKTRYTNKSAVLNIAAGTPAVFNLVGLKANSKVYYRLNYKSSGQNTFTAAKQYSFMTARKTGSSFSFSVQGDTHPERPGKMFNSDLYYVTMANIASQQPDFHILLGDDFSIDPIISKGQADQANVEKIYRTHRDWLSIAGSSVPIFLVNGNHEQAAEYLLDGGTTNPAVLAGNARLKYFALPAPDNFYSGDTHEVPGVGLPRDYYSWTWGDALFISLDPYWHSKFPVDNVAGAVVPEDIPVTAPTPAASGLASPAPTNSMAPARPKPTNSPMAPAGNGSGKVSNLWSIGIGDEQYAWLKKTLETSTAKYKFIFAHHVLGTGRGAIEVSTNYEWGGADPKGISTFAKERPNWELPIHDLMVKNKVSIFFQGHDHIFVHQERDGLIYQSMPNPADDTFSYFNEAAYKSGTKAPNSGHVRVTVSGSQAKVEYFLAARTQDTSRKNLELAHSYVVKPKN
jgi:cell division septation protein DedD